VGQGHAGQGYSGQVTHNELLCVVVGVLITLSLGHGERPPPTFFSRRFCLARTISSGALLAGSATRKNRAGLVGRRRHSTIINDQLVDAVTRHARSMAYSTAKPKLRQQRNAYIIIIIIIFKIFLCPGTQFPRT